MKIELSQEELDFAVMCYMAIKGMDVGTRRYVTNPNTVETKVICEDVKIREMASVEHIIKLIRER